MRSKLIVILLVSLLAACQTTTGTHKVYPGTTGPEAEPLTPPPPAVEAKPIEPPPAPPKPVYPQSASEISGAAVTSLMKKANEYRAAGQPDQAAGVLERALRIEPRNYFVWSALGQAYLAQKNYAQAESVAQKSTALARGNYYVALENWKTIQAARMARGDAAGAALAGAQVASLQAQISGGTP